MSADHRPHRGSWEPGEQPWFRSGEFRSWCPFCGSLSAIRSDGDLTEDTGRIELYCTNPKCAAREMTVLVTRDGSGAGHRADVRALDDVDDPQRHESLFVDVGRLLARTGRDLADRRAARPGDTTHEEA